MSVGWFMPPEKWRPSALSHASQRIGLDTFLRRSVCKPTIETVWFFVFCRKTETSVVLLLSHKQVGHLQPN
jgi:hypothetical protein